jgi:glycosyltransferase involved in cell wall biosynthesis
MQRKPQRVLYVENGIGYGGAIICLRHLVKHLDYNRYQPLLITGRTGERYRDIANDVPWKHIPDRHFDTVGWRAKLDAATFPSRIPGLRFVLSQLIARTDDLGNFLPFFIQFLWTAICFRPHIIHTNNEPLCNRAAVLVAKMMRVKLAAHVRSNLEASKLLHWLYTKPDLFLSVSHWVSDALADLDVPEDKRRVIYDGIDLSRLNIHAGGTPFRQQHQIGNDDFAVGLVGLLIPWKGQRIFLEAAKQLHTQIPGLKMVIVGGTPDECSDYEAELRRTVSNEGLQDCVLFTGNINDMPSAYNGLDIVVSASTDPEPLGTMVIECMAMARPLIGPAHGGAAEMADHEETALLFKPGSADDLAESILRLYREPELRQHIATQARQKALLTFAVETHADAVQALYDSMTGTATPKES